MAGKPAGSTNGETRDKVLELFEKEADMDGVVIVSMIEIGKRLGISGQAVAYHVQKLLDDGTVVRTSKTGYAHQLCTFEIVDF